MKLPGSAASAQPVPDRRPDAFFGDAPHGPDQFQRPLLSRCLGPGPGSFLIVAYHRLAAGTVFKHSRWQLN